MIGKQSYIPPEQFRGKSVPQSDIYSVGGTIHFLLTGKDPEPISVSHPARLNTLVSDSMDALVATCTEPELSGRMQSGFELKEALTRITPASSGASVAGGRQE